MIEWFRLLVAILEVRNMSSKAAQETVDDFASAFELYVSVASRQARP